MFRRKTDAERVSLASLRTRLPGHHDTLRTALKALPAPAARTAAQRRDAKIMRAEMDLCRAVYLILDGTENPDVLDDQGVEG